MVELWEFYIQFTQFGITEKNITMNRKTASVPAGGFK